MHVFVCTFHSQARVAFHSLNAINKGYIQQKYYFKLQKTRKSVWNKYKRREKKRAKKKNNLDGRISTLKNSIIKEHEKENVHAKYVYNRYAMHYINCIINHRFFFKSYFIRIEDTENNHDFSFILCNNK